MIGQRDPRSGPLRIAVTSRRDLLLNARTFGLLLAVPSVAVMPQAIAGDAAPASAASDMALGKLGAQGTIQRLLRGAKPIDGKINIEMPEIAENGNVVPFAITAESPMTESAYIKTIHVICSGNVQSLIGSFHFTTLSGKATVITRMRLAKTQDLFILVERSDGQFILAQRTVKVTIGGCGGT